MFTLVNNYWFELFITSSSEKRELLFIFLTPIIMGKANWILNCFCTHISCILISSCRISKSLGSYRPRLYESRHAEIAVIIWKSDLICQTWARVFHKGIEALKSIIIPAYLPCIFHMWNATFELGLVNPTLLNFTFPYVAHTLYFCIHWFYQWRVTRVFWWFLDLFDGGFKSQSL